MDMETIELLELAQARIDQLADALKTAKETIKSFHGMGFRSIPPDRAENMWILYQQSPEMQKINIALTGV